MKAEWLRYTGMTWFMNLPNGLIIHTKQDATNHIGIFGVSEALQFIPDINYNEESRELEVIKQTEVPGIKTLTEFAEVYNSTKGRG